MIDDPLFGAYEMRLIVLMENEDHDGFNQVMLNEEQFKKVSDAICVSVRKDASLKEGYDLAQFKLDDERTLPPDLFDGMNSINP